MIKVLTKKESTGPVVGVLKLSDLACKLAGDPYGNTTSTGCLDARGKGAM